MQTFLRTVARVVGVGGDQGHRCLLPGIRGHGGRLPRTAQAVDALLGDPSTAFVLVTSPRRDAMEEATFFADRLASNGQRVQALIVNRIHPAFGDELPMGLRTTAEALRLEQSEPAERLAALYENLADFRDVALLEREHIDGLRHKIGSAVAGIRAVPRPRRVRLRGAARDRRPAARRRYMTVQ